MAPTTWRATGRPYPAASPARAPCRALGTSGRDGWFATQQCCTAHAAPTAPIARAVSGDDAPAPVLPRHATTNHRLGPRPRRRRRPAPAHCAAARRRLVEAWGQQRRHDDPPGGGAIGGLPAPAPATAGSPCHTRRPRRSLTPLPPSSPTGAEGTAPHIASDTNHPCRIDLS